MRSRRTNPDSAIVASSLPRAASLRPAVKVRKRLEAAINESRDGPQMLPSSRQICINDIGEIFGLDLSTHEPPPAGYPAWAALRKGCRSKAEAAAIKKRKRKAKKRKADWERQRQAKAEPDYVPPPPPTFKKRRYIQRSYGRQELIRRLLDPDVGFELDRWDTFDNCYYAPFAERGPLPSLRGNRHLERWPAILPKRDRLMTGMTKGPVYKSGSKIIGLTHRYVMLDRRRIGALIVDIDESFDCENSFRRKLLKILPASAMPNLVVGYLDSGGHLRRPHLIWILPPGSEVRGAPKYFYYWQRVQMALTAKLLTLGADPGATANPYKCKNPVSPFWSKFDFNPEWLTLDRLVSLADLNLNITESRLYKMASLAKTHDQKASNGLWVTIGRLVKDALLDGLRRKSRGYARAVAAGPDALAGWLRARVEPKVRQCYGEMDRPSKEGRDLAVVIDRRITWAAKNWDEKNPNRLINEGRDDDELTALGLRDEQGRPTDPRASRKVAGRRTSAIQKEDSIAEIGNAIVRLIGDTGEEPTPAAVARAVLKVKKSTVYSHFAVAMARIRVFQDGPRYIAPLVRVLTPTVQTERGVRPAEKPKSGVRASQTDIGRCRPEARGVSPGLDRPRGRSEGSVRDPLGGRGAGLCGVGQATSGMFPGVGGQAGRSNGQFDTADGDADRRHPVRAADTAADGAPCNVIGEVRPRLGSYALVSNSRAGAGRATWPDDPASAPERRRAKPADQRR